MSSLSSPYQLPRDILGKWQPVLSSLELSEPESALLQAVIGYALPPMSRESLCQALALYRHDIDSSFTLPAETTIRAISIPEQPSQAYGRSHPIFFAMTDQRRGLAALDNGFQQAARRMLSSFFSAVSKEAAPEILYSDVQQCRDVLRSLADIDTPAPTAGDSLDRYMIEQVNLHLAGRPGTSSVLSSKTQRFQQLYAGLRHIQMESMPSRLPGMRKQQRHRSKAHSGRARKRHTDPGLTEQIQHALTQAVRNKSSITKPLRKRARDQEEPRSIGWSAVVDTRSYHVSASPKRRGEDLDDADITVTRRIPSLLTPSDDQHVLARARRLAATDGLMSMNNIQRLTANQIHESLTHCRDKPAAWALAILLLTTGMPLKHLVELAQTEALPGDPGALSLTTPRWNREHQLLWYSLLDGPSGDADAPHRWVVLSLPTLLNEALESALAEGNAPYPLQQAERLLGRELKRQFRHTCGLCPSPRRLAASSWMLIRPHARDDIAAKALGRQFGVSHAAPAAYRRLDPGELNALFQSCLTCLMPDETAHKRVAVEPGPANRQAVPASLATLWRTGSAQARPPEWFRPWFSALHITLRQAMHRFYQPLAPSARRPDDLLAVINASAAHTYLTMLLATGCRPHAGRARCQLIGNQLWIADKDSPRYRESRAIPVIPRLRDALLGHQALVEEVTGWLTRHGYQIDDSRAAGVHLRPGHYRVVSKRRRQLALVPMTHRDFLALLKRVPHEEASPCWEFTTTPRNVTRHSVTSYLRSRVPEPVLSALLGHVMNGFRHASPGSTALAPRRGELSTALTALLHEAGAKPLPCQEIVHALID